MIASPYGFDSYIQPGNSMLTPFYQTPQYMKKKSRPRRVCSLLKDDVVRVRTLNFQFLELIDLLVVLEFLKFAFHVIDDDGQLTKDVVNTNVFVIVLRISHNTS